MNNIRTTSALLCGLAGGTASAASAPAVSTGAWGVAGMVFSLLLILGLFVLAAWLAKRYLPQMGKSGPVKIIGASMVGTREKVVVVEVENTWLVLGVGGGQVRTLHTLPKPHGADGKI